MSQELKLKEAVIELTGDGTIFDVAEFRPRGSAGATVAGAMVGSLAGGDNVWGQGIGLGLGSYAGQSIQSAVSRLPKYMAVAVSPTEVYLLGIPEGIWTTRKEDVYPIAKIDRDQLGVEVHQRVQVRILVLEDLESGARYELEAPRLNFYHAKTLIELLKVSEGHHDTEEEPEAAADTTA